MYKYSELDQTLVNERVEQFRDQTRRFLDGELSEAQYLPLRLQNGLYIQRFAPMLRIAIPYGTLSSTQLRKLGDIAQRYDKGYGHFTTRTNLQLNWPKLEDVPEILAELATVQMHAIQTSGNCIRNTTTDALAGVAADEIDDPRPWCEIIRQWSTFHPEFNWLPRKFKIAFSSSTTDRAATAVHDIGVHIVKNDAGELGYRIFVGGGLGRMPMIGHCIREFLPEADLFSYLEAVMRIYNRLGRRDNIHRARVKVLVKATGPEAFRDMVEAEWQQIDHAQYRLQPEDIAYMKSFFPAPDYAEDAASEDYLRLQEQDSAFRAFVKSNVHAHRQDGYKVVFVSLKAKDIAPGDATAEQMELVADLADRYGFGEIRTTHDQNLVLPDIAEKDVYAVWQRLAEHGLATPNIGLVTDLICCPGLDFCSLANAGSIGVNHEIFERFDALDYQYDVGPIKLKMSGCMNGCGHHSVGHIGILGVDKKGQEWYQITLGGSSENDATLGDRTGPSFDREDVAEAVETIIRTYLDVREGEEERFLDCYRRVGMAPFKAALYPAKEKAA